MSAASAGAIGAVIGWMLGLGAAGLISRFVRGRPAWLRLAPVLGAVLCAGAAAAMQRTPVLEAPVDHLDDVAWVRVLKANYPQDYARLRARVSSAHGFDEAAGALGETLASVAGRQRPKADAVSARAMFAVRRDEGRTLQAVDVPGCAAFMSGRGAPASLAKVVTPELAARDRAAVAGLLEQAAVHPAPPVTAISLRELAQMSLSATRSFHDSDQNLLIDMLRTVRTPVTADESRVMCAYHLALADYLLAKPPAEGGALIRSLWALDDTP